MKNTVRGVVRTVSFLVLYFSYTTNTKEKNKNHTYYLSNFDLILKTDNACKQFEIFLSVNFDIFKESFRFFPIRKNISNVQRSHLVDWFNPDAVHKISV